MGKVVSVNVSKTKGVAKQPVAEIELLPGLGVKDDAHSAPGDRQVSLLMEESIARAKQSPEMAECAAKSGKLELGPGAYAENITTSGIDLLSLALGDVLQVGDVRLRVSKIGKECPKPCAIYYKLGSCIMPTQGIFGAVETGGTVRPGDQIEPG